MYPTSQPWRYSFDGGGDGRMRARRGRGNVAHLARVNSRAGEGVFVGSHLVAGVRLGRQVVVWWTVDWRCQKLSVVIRSISRIAPVCQLTKRSRAGEMLKCAGKVTCIYAWPALFAPPRLANHQASTQLPNPSFSLRASILSLLMILIYS